MQEARRHGAFVCVHQTNTTVRAFVVRDSSCEDHPTCKKVRDCERGMRPNVEASTRRGRAVKVIIPEMMATPLVGYRLGAQHAGVGWAVKRHTLF